MKTLREIVDEQTVRMVEAGGPGSGCQGPNCGRPKSSSSVETAIAGRKISWTVPDDARKEKGKLRVVSLENLLWTQNRFHEDRIKDLESKIRSGAIKSLPALTVVRVKGSPGMYWCLDGHHRMAAIDNIANNGSVVVWDTGAKGPSEEEGY